MKILLSTEQIIWCQQCIGRVPLPSGCDPRDTHTYMEQCSPTRRLHVQSNFVGFTWPSFDQYNPSHTQGCIKG